MQLKNVELVKLGHRIRRARKLLGFSQKDFSTKSGLDRSYYDAWLSGKSGKDCLGHILGRLNERLVNRREGKLAQEQ